MLRVMPGDSRPGITAYEVPALVPGESGGRDRQGRAPPRWAITDHAVTRYRERCPGKRALSPQEASDELEALSAVAHFVKLLPRGIELWRGGKPYRLRYRVSRDAPGLPQLVTVLRGCDII